MSFLFVNILYVGKTIYITADTEAFWITSNGNNLTCLPEPSLESNQQEADTKVFLCANFAAELGYQKVRIVTVNSDMGILALYYQQKIKADLLLKIGTGPNLKIIDISTHDLPVDVTDVLPGLHAISGWWLKEMSFYPSVKCKVPYDYGDIGRIYWIGAEYTISARRICL